MTHDEPGAWERLVLESGDLGHLGPFLGLGFLICEVVIPLGAASQGGYRDDLRHERKGLCEQ